MNTSTFRLIIAGSRQFDDYETLTKTLNKYTANIPADPDLHP